MPFALMKLFSQKGTNLRSWKKMREFGQVPQKDTKEWEEFKRWIVSQPDLGHGTYRIWDNDPRKKGPERAFWKGKL